MKTKYWVLVPVLAILTAGTAVAHGGRTSFAYAQVIRVEPIVRYVTVERPHRECWEETAYKPLPSDRPLRDAAPAIAGGVIGGVIGHELGNRHNRGALTLLGAVAGSAIANERSLRNSRQYEAVTVERCAFVNDRVVEERVTAYDVTYRYHGRRYRMRTRNHPGDRVRVRVNVAPVYLR
jgi:uncharacterized protein YcfJ